MNQFAHQDQPFSAGAPLWIIADLQNSAWAKKLDWYLNFQLRRASRHQPLKISQTVKEKISSWGFTVPEAMLPAAPLMIASRRLLPNELTVQIPVSETWVQDCLQVIRQLRLKKVRVFLPVPISAQEFKNFVNKNSHENSVGGDICIEFVDEKYLEAGDG